MKAIFQIVIFGIGILFGVTGTIFFIAEDIDSICGQIRVPENASGFFGNGIGDELQQGNLSFIFEVDESEDMKEHLDWLDKRGWDYSTEFAKGKYHVNATCSTDGGV